MEKSSQIYGIRAIMEAVRANTEIDKVFLQKGLKGDLMRELEQLLRKNDITLAYVPVEKLNRLTKDNHQGAVANVSPIRFHTLEQLMELVEKKTSPALILLLDQLSDVRNFGAIIRTAACTGVDGIVIQRKGAAPVTADTIKTSAGAAFTVPIVKVGHLKDAVFFMQASGIQVVAATEKAEKTVYDIPLTAPTAIIMGAEDRGISPSMLKAADHLAKLPLLGNIGSLNVSVACGVLLYEAVRQRS
ncbi:23S rRNA (guanosine(2251)-2'-O)-methyltransferase RlmB [Maribacter sp. 2307ULW6-5]|uniref:23S rRNA (guanosine(2251)-2'-O)-methyltransferase RlmB n=1 Tax=Maribacter sp. 2307ULW6-5 TaxID=3386275 RepID=UPI0039BC3A1D